MSKKNKSKKPKSLGQKFNRPDDRVRYEDRFGNLLYTTTREAIEFMMAKGQQIEKIGAKQYRETKPVEPSTSRDSAASLTRGDMNALAGMNFLDAEISVQQHERLIGWGLVAA